MLLYYSEALEPHSLLVGDKVIQCSFDIGPQDCHALSRVLTFYAKVPSCELAAIFGNDTVIFADCGPTWHASV